MSGTTDPRAAARPRRGGADPAQGRAGPPQPDAVLLGRPRRGVRAAAAGGRPHPDRVPAAVPPRRGRGARTSTPPTPATCGTWSTGRTGRSASRCSAACPRGPTRTAGSRRWRTTPPTSGAGCCPRLRLERDELSRFDYVVVGLGALGCATAHQLARRGHSVLGLERFELGHHRGAQPRHQPDPAAQLPHARVRPAHPGRVRRLGAAVELGRSATLVTVVGGLDLFPPDPAIPLADYTASLTEVGIDFELLDVAEIAARWPQFALPAGTVGLYQDRGAIVPAGPRHRGDAGPGARGTAPSSATAPRSRGRDRAPRSTVADGTTYPAGGVVALRRRVDQPAAAPARRRPAADGDAGAGDVLRAGAPGGLRARTGCRCGSGWTSRRSTASPATASRPSRRPRTAAARSSTRTPAASEPDPAMLDLLAGHVGRMLPGAGPPVRSLRCQYTLTPDRDFVLDRVPGHPSRGRRPRRAATASSSRRPSAGCSPTWPRRGTATACAVRLDRPALTDPAYQAHWLV